MSRKRSEDMPTSVEGVESQEGNGTVQAAPDKPQESKRSRFLRLAEKRVNKCLKAMRQVENMGNRASYDYTDEEAAAIVQALADAMDRVDRKFAGVDDKKDGFRF